MSNIMMKAGLAGALLFAAFTGAAHAGVDSDLDLVNTHGSASIVGVWFAPSNEEGYWHAGNLSSPIYPRNWTSLRLTNLQTCNYDFKVRFSDGYEQRFDNINLCAGRQRLIAT